MARARLVVQRGELEDPRPVVARQRLEELGRRAVRAAGRAVAVLALLAVELGRLGERRIPALEEVDGGVAPRAVVVEVVRVRIVGERLEQPTPAIPEPVRGDRSAHVVEAPFLDRPQLLREVEPVPLLDRIELLVGERRGAAVRVVLLVDPVLEAQVVRRGGRAVQHLEGAAEVGLGAGVLGEDLVARDGRGVELVLELRGLRVELAAGGQGEHAGHARDREGVALRRHGAVRSCRVALARGDPPGELRPRTGRRPRGTEWAAAVDVAGCRVAVLRRCRRV